MSAGRAGSPQYEAARARDRSLGFGKSEVDLRHADRMRRASMATTKKIITQKKLTDDDAALLENLEAAMSTSLEQVRAIVRGRARGTGDVAAQAAAALAQADEAKAALAPPPPPTLEARVEAHLRGSSARPSALARAVREPEARVLEVLARLRQEERLVNVGLETDPIYAWRIGDAPTSELVEFARRMLSERPMTTKQLADAAGCQFTRMGGAVVALQRDSSVRILDLSKTHTACWFIVSDEARDAHLSPKKRK